jgi:PhnB protein
MQLNPHLSFSGQCEEAFKFYEQSIGGKIEFIMTYGDSPVAAQAPPGWAEKVMHATIRVAGQTLMGGDAPPDHFQKPQGFALAISLNDAAEAERMFNQLAEGGSVQMRLEKTFWAERFGMLTDRFGVPWMINCAKPS